MSKKQIERTVKYKLKYRPKNCSLCVLTEENQMDYCLYHKRYDYPYILKEIKETKKERKKWRMILFSAIIFLFFTFGYSLYYLSNYGKDNTTITILIESFILIPILIWILLDNEKTTKKELKELDEEKDKWIVIFELENLDDYIKEAFAIIEKRYQNQDRKYVRKATVNAILENRKVC